MKLRVNEMFYSLQGEGARAGNPSLFIRLAGCSAKFACFESGVLCDTEFEPFHELEVEDILAWCLHADNANCPWIVWTGGEPLDQLTPEVVQVFRKQGFSQALETSGSRCLTPEMACMLDWIVVSPKVAEHVLVRHFERRHRDVDVDELRYVRHAGQGIPDPKLRAKRKFLSPHADGSRLNDANVRWCVDLVKKHPEWSLSLQQHKLMGIR